MKKIFSCIITLSFCMVCAAQNLFKVQPGALIKATGGALITLQNMNLENEGNINQGPGEGKFLFTGTTDNTISGTGTVLFDIIEIAKTGSAKVSLQKNIQVGSGITFTSGLIDLNNNNILLQPAALLIGETETSRITGTTGGYIEITNTLNAPSAANPGNLGAIITSGQNMGSTIIRRGHTSQMNGYGQGNTIYRYYDILPTNNTALNATLRLNYFDAELNGLNENTITLWKSTNTTTWFDMGFNTRNIAANYVEKNSLADFSRWTLTSTLNPLPLLWGSFNTQCNNSGIKISWQTFQENNTASFTIQHSNSGVNWTDMTTLLAAGNSSSAINYMYTDPQSNGTINYYRIIAQDKDGRKTWSPVLKNTCGTDKEMISVYPVPTQNNLWVNITSASNTNISLQLYDSKGALVKQQTNKIQAGNSILEMRLGGIAAGSYYLLINNSDGKLKQVKVIKQ